MEESELERLLGGPPRVTYEEIANHPRMPEARKAYLERVLELYGDDHFMVRLLHQAGRFYVFHLALILEAAQDPKRRETWVTIGLLKEKMAMLGGVVSDRQVDHLIARLCEVGFLETRASEQDRRVRIISTTEKLRAHDRDWLVAHYAGLAILYPQHDYGLIMRRDPAFQLLLRSMGPLLIPLGAKFINTPYMLFFFESAGAYPVFAALMLAAMAQPDGAHVAVPYAEVGEKFGVSRTHVRKLLGSLQQEGLVKLHARGGHRVEILPHYWPNSRSRHRGRHVYPRPAASTGDEGDGGTSARGVAPRCGRKPSLGSDPLEHFPEKWTPVFRQKMRSLKEK